MFGGGSFFDEVVGADLQSSMRKQREQQLLEATKKREQQLLEATTAGDLATLKRLLAAAPDGLDVNAWLGTSGSTALMTAAHNGHADCVAELLRHEGVDIDMSDSTCGVMAVTLAAGKAGERHLECVRLLLDAGACVDGGYDLKNGGARAALLTPLSQVALHSPPRAIRLR